MVTAKFSLLATYMNKELPTTNTQFNIHCQIIVNIRFSAPNLLPFNIRDKLGEEGVFGLEFFRHLSFEQ